MNTQEQVGRLRELAPKVQHAAEEAVALVGRIETLAAGLTVDANVWIDASHTLGWVREEEEFRFVVCRMKDEDADQDEEEEFGPLSFPFAEAPPDLQILAFNFLPKLMEKMAAAAEKALKDMEETRRWLEKSLEALAAAE